MTGIREAFQRVQARGLAGALERLLSAGEEVLFDAAHGTDTRRFVSLNEMTIAEGPLQGAIRYEPPRLRPFRRILSRLKPNAQSVFVDFGCGKGRTLLAAAPFGFKRVEGVEFTRNLCETARRNIAAYKRRTGLATEFRIFEGDAGRYPTPDDADLFYYFNPFGPEVMTRTVENIVASLGRAPRAAALIYMNPIYRSAVERFGVFRAAEESCDYVVYRNG